MIDSIEKITNILQFDNSVADINGELETQVKKILVTDQMVLDYVQVSGDDNQIHVNDEAAKEAGFAEGKIAHGTLLTGLAFSAIAEMFGHNLDITKVEVFFKRPVYVGKEAEIEVTKSQSEDEGIQKFDFKIKSEVKNRMKLSSEGSVSYKVKDSNCDSQNLKRTLMIGWIAKETVENIHGVAVTHLAIDFIDTQLSEERPTSTKEEEAIDHRMASQRTNFKGFYSNKTQIYSGFYVLSNPAWRKR